MAGENSNSERDFGHELRDATGDRTEQRRLLREMVMGAAGIDEDAARRVFDAFHDARVVFVTEEGWERTTEQAKSLGRLINFSQTLRERVGDRHNTDPTHAS